MVSAIERVFGIAELVEMVALGLPYKDLLQFQRITKFCNLVVAGSQRLQKKQWLIPDRSSDTGPHFELHEPDPVRRLQYLGEYNFVHTFRTLAITLLHSQMLTEDIRTFMTFHHIATGHLAQTKQRLMAQSVRGPRPHGIIHVGCDVCRGAHIDFIWPHIHPLLHVLESKNICISGEGDRLLLNTGLFFGFGHPQAPRPRAELVMHCMNDLLALAKTIRGLFDKMRAYALDDQQFTRPACMRLVVSDGQWCYHDTSETGVTVKDALKLLAVSCRTTANMGDVWMRELRELATLRPNDWCERWFDVYEEVKEVLSGEIVAWADFEGLVDNEV